MNYLANGIKKYYKKSNRKIIFKNNLTLNELALRMWETSNFRGTDSSVVSKVLSGERLFTPSQLKIFCELLRIQKVEKEYLFYCLEKDYIYRHGICLQSLFLPSHDTVDMLEKLTEEAKMLSHLGKSYILYRQTTIIEEYLSNLLYRLTDSNFDKKIDELYSKVLFLKGVAIGRIAMPEEIIQKTRAITTKLQEHNKRFSNRRVEGYLGVLLANAWYIKGAYSSTLNTAFLAKSIKYASEAMKILPRDDPEYLSALRTIVVSSIELDDKDTFKTSLSEAQYIAFLQTKNNFASSIHLAGTLAKGIAKYHLGDPFRFKEEVKRYFNQDLSNCEVYELSELKMYFETLQLLQSRSNKQSQRIVNQALLIGGKENYLRHKQVIIALNEA